MSGPLPLVRVQDATLVADGGPAWFVVSHLPDASAVADRAASAGGSTSIDEAGRLRVLVSPQQLVNAVGRVDADLGHLIAPQVDAAVSAWQEPNVTVPIAATEQGVRPGPMVMGILNVTPDSFSDGGRAFDEGRHPNAAIEAGVALLEAGADIIDVGGESTRPGADPVDVRTELERVIPVVAALAARGAVVSIDTTKAQVAREAVAAGAGMVNDVSAGTFDTELLAVVGELQVPYVLMHLVGTPRSMQADPTYDDVVAEVFEFLAEGIRRCANFGIAAERIIVDPGIGFGKSTTHNLGLLSGLRQLASLGRPTLVGASRKSFIQGIIGHEVSVDDRLPGSLAVAVEATHAGAAIVRVHDVAETRQAVAVAAAVRQAGRS